MTSPVARPGNPPGLLDRLKAGDERALATAITLVERRAPAAREVLRGAWSATGRALVVGVTGFPGGGKSSLVDRLAAHYRAEGRSVGILAVDPSSAFSGGAILGDRVRMQRHTADPGVFIRSMATRGALGGLSKAALDAVDLMDASGREVILLETVGVGQDEIDVVRVADCVAVVLVPGLGDEIQAIKAGILEIADVFVINKADHAGADRLQADLDAMLAMAPEAGATGPPPPIVRTVAIRDEGTLALAEAIGKKVFSPGGGTGRRLREQSTTRLMEMLGDALIERLRAESLGDAELRQLAGEIAGRRKDPWTAVDEILGRVRFGPPH